MFLCFLHQHGSLCWTLQEHTCRWLTLVEDWQPEEDLLTNTQDRSCKLHDHKMNISVAQLRPFAGDIGKNIKKHIQLTELAASKGADMIFFPELSLTGYEPKLAKELATGQDDKRFNELQKICDEKNIVIGAGVPTRSDRGVRISMIVFEPRKPRQTYSKQHLHSDEHPYFVNGDQQLILTVSGKKIAPAICYESLLPEHSESAFKSGADIYIASVAKSAKGVAKAYKHYPAVAKKYSMLVLMSNCIGPSDDFESVGGSAGWNKQGELLGQLDKEREGILVIDTDTEDIISWPG